LDVSTDELDDCCLDNPNNPIISLDHSSRVRRISIESMSQGGALLFPASSATGYGVTLLGSSAKLSFQIDQGRQKARPPHHEKLKERVGLVLGVKKVLTPRPISLNISNSKHLFLFSDTLGAIHHIGKTKTRFTIIFASNRCEFFRAIVKVR
jgi:hypothetical protein